MSEERIIKALDSIIKRIPGLLSIWITDRDGIPVVRVPEVESEDDNEKIVEAFAHASDKATKLQQGDHKSFTTFYDDDKVVVQRNHRPLVTTFFGDSGLDVGLVLALGPEYDTLIEAIRTVY